MNRLSIKALRNTTFAVLYIFLVSQIMLNGDKWFGEANNNLGSFVVLLLFCLSAAVVGGLIFGESVMLFLDNKKKDSLKVAFYSVVWLGAYTVFGLLMLLILK